MDFLKHFIKEILDNKEEEILEELDFQITLNKFLELQYWDNKEIELSKKIEILNKNKKKILYQFENLKDKYLLRNGNLIQIRKNNYIKFSIFLLNSGMFKTYLKNISENDRIIEELLYADRNTIILKKGPQLNYFDKHLFYSLLAYSKINENVLQLDLYQLRKYLGMNAYNASDKQRIIKSLETLSMTFLKIKSEFYISNNEKAEISNFFNLFTFSEIQIKENNKIIIELHKQFYELLALKNPENKLTFRYLNIDKFNSLKNTLSKLIYERMLVLGRKNYSDVFFDRDSINILEKKYGYIPPIQNKNNKRYISNSKLLKQLEEAKIELKEKLNIDLVFVKDKEEIYKLKYKFN